MKCLLRHKTLSSVPAPTPSSSSWLSHNTFVFEAISCCSIRHFAMRSSILLLDLFKNDFQFHSLLLQFSLIKTMLMYCLFVHVLYCLNEMCVLISTPCQTLQRCWTRIFRKSEKRLQTVNDMNTIQCQTVYQPQL